MVIFVSQKALNTSFRRPFHSIWLLFALFWIQVPFSTLKLFKTHTSSHKYPHYLPSFSSKVFLKNSFHSLQHFATKNTTHTKITHRHTSHIISTPKPQKNVFSQHFSYFKCFALKPLMTNLFFCVISCGRIRETWFPFARKAILDFYSYVYPKKLPLWCSMNFFI